MNELVKYQVVKKLGTEKKRKFNQVSLVKDGAGKLFVLKSCPIDNQHGCELLLRESKFYFEAQGLPQKSILNKSKNELQLFLPYKNGIPLSDYWLLLKKKERTHFLQYFIACALNLLHSIHQKGVFHNDIKPSNFLVDNDQIHLIDFGMAIQKKEASRKVLYSLVYSSPELILNQTQLINASSDIFSFAMVLIELISGKILFSHENPAIYTQMSIAYPILLKGVVPHEFVEILEKCCSKPKLTTSSNRLPKEQLEQALILAQAKRKIEFNALKAQFNNAFDSYVKRRKRRILRQFKIA